MIKIEFEDNTPTINTCNLHLTDAAETKLNKVFANKPTSFLQISVISGGCNGFSYCFDIKDEKKETDIVININKINLITDPTSAQYLNNCTVDFVEELQASHFKIINPNATSTCSCGTSFSI
jgi:iron-sulfur cluster assembly accessory protein